MKIYKIVTLLTLALLTTQCTIFQKSNKSKNSEQYRQQDTKQVEIVQPDRSSVEIVQPEFVTPDAPIISPIVEKEPIITATVPLSTFSSAELEHIKFAEYDPFPTGSSSFTIDLDKASKEFTYPLTNGKLSSSYGQRGRSFHSGVDLLQEQGTPIYAAFDGVVRMSKPYAAYGNVIVIRHSNGLETIYSHNHKNLAKAGDKVKSGDKIALVGRTGNATANHLHFEVRILGQTINPSLLIDPHKGKLQDGRLDVKRNGTKIMASNNKSGVSTPVRPSQPAPEDIKTVAQSTPQSTTAKSGNSTSTATAQYHTIVKGDTLYGLSRRYGTTVSSICSLNSITDKTILSLGRKLRIK